MPVAPQAGIELGHDDQVPLADLDHAATSGTDVLLARGVGLHRSDDLYPERIAHRTSASAMSSVPATMARSTAVLRCCRNGLKPIAGIVGPGSVPAMFRVTDDGPVRTLIIDNPAHRNAIGPSEFAGLASRVEDFEASDARVLVITGAGEDFCSGLDLAIDGSYEGGIAQMTRAMEGTTRAALALYRASKPTVAAVDGVAVGAGMNIALCCDVVIASDRARFAEIFVRRGLTLDFGGTWTLPRLVGMARAKELALSGRVFGAAEALAYGITTEIVGPEQLQARAHSVATELAAGAPLAQRFVKQGLDRAFDMSFEEAIAHEAQAQALLLTSEDSLEGMLSFLQKRLPEFRGK